MGLSLLLPKRKLPAGPEDFFVGVFWSKHGRDGYFEEDGELWSPDCELIAQSRQLALPLPASREQP